MYFGIVALASLGLWGILPALFPITQDSVPPEPRLAGGAGEEVSTFGVPLDGAAGAPPVHDLVMSFFLGACAVLIALMAYEVYYWWRTSPGRRAEEKRE